MFIDPTNPHSVHERHDEDERWRHARRRHVFLTAAIVLLALAVGGATWYAYPELQRHEAALAQTLGVRKAVDALGSRIEEQKVALTEWGKSQEKLHDQMTGLGRELRSRIEAAKKQANQAAEESFRRAQAQVAG